MNHLDATTLATLKEIMGDDFALLLHTYIQDSNERLSAIHALITTADAERIRRAVHSVKGSSSNIGAFHLSELCAALEQRAARGELRSAASDLHTIEREFRAVEAELQPMLANQP